MANQVINNVTGLFRYDCMDVNGFIQNMIRHSTLKFLASSSVAMYNCFGAIFERHRYENKMDIIIEVFEDNNCMMGSICHQWCY